MTHRAYKENPAFSHVEGELPSADPLDPEAMKPHIDEMHKMIDNAVADPLHQQYAVITVNNEGAVAIDGTLGWEVLFLMGMSLANRGFVMAIMGGALSGNGSPEGAFHAIFNGEPFNYSAEGVDVRALHVDDATGEWAMHKGPIPPEAMEQAIKHGAFDAYLDPDGGLTLDGSIDREGEDAESVQAENDVLGLTGKFHPADLNHDGVVDESEMARWLDDGAGAAPGASPVDEECVNVDDFTPSEDNEAIADALSDTRASDDGMPETEDPSDAEFPVMDANFRDNAMVADGDLDDAGDEGGDDDIEEMMEEDGPTPDLSPLDADDEQDKG